MTTSLTQTILTIIRKDLLAELRSRELVSSMGLFTLLSILAFSFALELNRDAQEEVVGGVLWVTLVFASVLGLNRSLAQEREQGNLDAMMIAPIPRVGIYAGKLTGNFIFTLLVGLILLPLMTVLFDMPLMQPTMAIILGLGILGLSSMGTLLSAMTVQTRSRETLLPIVMLPVALPIILVVVSASNGMLDSKDVGVWLGALAGIDLIYITLGSLLFEYVTED